MSIVAVSIYVDPNAEPDERWNFQGIMQGVTIRGRGHNIETAAMNFENDLGEKFETVEEG